MLTMYPATLPSSLSALKTFALPASLPCPKSSVWLVYAFKEKRGCYDARCSWIAPKWSYCRVCSKIMFSGFSSSFFSGMKQLSNSKNLSATSRGKKKNEASQWSNIRSDSPIHLPVIAALTITSHQQQKRGSVSIKLVRKQLIYINTNTLLVSFGCLMAGKFQTCARRLMIYLQRAVKLWWFWAPSYTVLLVKTWVLRMCKLPGTSTHSFTPFGVAKRGWFCPSQCVPTYLCGGWKGESVKMYQPKNGSCKQSVHSFALMHFNVTRERENPVSVTFFCRTSDSTRFYLSFVCSLSHSWCRWKAR